MKKNDLQRKIILNEFEDKYNPLKVHAELRKLDLPNEPARQLSNWYEDIFYKQVMDLYQREKTKRIWDIK